MVASLVEWVQGTNGSTGTGPIATLTTTPLPGDVAYVTLQAGATNRALSGVTGLGATWSEVATVNASSSVSQIVWRGVGPTTAGTIALTVNTSSNGSVRAFLVRGVTLPDFVVATTLGASGSVACPGPVQVAGAGCFVLALGNASARTSGNLLEGTLPATGWAIQTSPAATTIYHHTGYLAPATTGPAQATVQAGANAGRQITQVLFGVPPPSGFTGWGVPA